MKAATFRRVAVMAITSGLASACAPGQQTQSTVYDTAIKSEVEAQIAQSGARAANALETLAMVQRTRTPPVATPVQEANLPPELKKPSTVEWSGPGNALSKEIASNLGYSFLESGPAPSHPALVQIDAKNESSAKVLEDIGLQVQSFATVIVDPTMRRIEYRNISASGDAVERAPRHRAYRSATHAPSLRRHDHFSK